MGTLLEVRPRKALGQAASAWLGEEQEPTCELLVVRAVGNCVFSQSHNEILIPGSRQLVVKEEK